MRVISPMATGNGAYIVHKMLEGQLTNYSVAPYNPYWTLMPIALPFLFRGTSDIIHTTPDYACFFSRKNTPLVLTLHNYVLDRFMHSYSSTLQNIHYKTDLKWFIERSLKQANIVTSVSKFTSQLLREQLRFDKDIDVIPNGVDTLFFHPFHKNKCSKKITVLFSGNLTRRKGAQWLPDIAKKFKNNIELICTGGLNKTKLMIRKDNVKCIGAIPYNEMPAIYNSVDLLLMPTVREGMSLAILEAMACGIPVVATDCSSNPELIDNDKGGYLCPLGDTAKFAEKINNLAENPILVKQMGDYNRAKVEKQFTLKKMLGRYERVFEKAMA